MSLLGNILWLIFGGFLAVLGYVIGGIVMCLTIVGIPFGVAAFRMAGASFAPFGKTAYSEPGGGGCLSLVFNILWIVLFGWEIALVHITFGIILAITIVGLPFAQQHFKLLPVALLPFSYRLE